MTSSTKNIRANPTYAEKFTLEKKVTEPVPEVDSMIIDISEEVENEINEYVEETNEDEKETDEIETIETADVSFFNFKRPN